jgi:hypothetical protein
MALEFECTWDDTTKGALLYILGWILREPSSTFHFWIDDEFPRQGLLTGEKMMLNIFMACMAFVWNYLWLLHLQEEVQFYQSEPTHHSVQCS